MSRRNAFLAAGVALVVLAAVLAVALGRDGPHGAATPEEAVTEYLAALRANDRDRLERVADPEHAADAEISARLQRLGGDKLTIDQTKINDTAADHEKNVTLTGRLETAPFVESLWLDRHESRWYVVLGPYRNARPKG